MKPGNSLSSIALSGLQAAQAQLQGAAHNVANLATEGFRRVQTTQQAVPGGGVEVSTERADSVGPALEQDVVAQLQAKNAFLANLAVFRTADRMAGSLLDERA